MTFTWPEEQLGPFPMHDDEHKLLKDITQWESVIKPPVLPTADEVWGPAMGIAGSVNRDEKFVALFHAPGLFEMTHHKMGVEDALMALYEEPECMQGLINRIVDYEIYLSGYVR